MLKLQRSPTWYVWWKFPGSLRNTRRTLRPRRGVVPRRTLWNVVRRMCNPGACIVKLATGRVCVCVCPMKSLSVPGAAYNLHYKRDAARMWMHFHMSWSGVCVCVCVCVRVCVRAVCSCSMLVELLTWVYRRDLNAYRCCPSCVQYSSNNNSATAGQAYS